MSIHLHSDVQQLEFLNERLARTSFNTSRDSLLERINKKVKDVQIDTSAAYNPLQSELKQVLIQVLNSLEKQLVDSEKELSLKNTIAKVKLEIEKSPTIYDKKPQLSPKTDPVKLAFFCDLDGSDHNGAITSSLRAYLEEEIPFVTTRSLLAGVGMDESTFSNKTLTQTVIYNNKEKWDILLQDDHENGSGFVLFIPKKLHEDKTLKEKLELLDFATDDSLKKVEPNMIFSAPEQKESIDSFGALFTKDPKAEKIVMLDGHGSQNVVGAMNLEHYNQFQSILEQQKTKAMLIISCYSGGISGMNALDPKPPEQPGFDSHFSHAPFVTITRSIGDFVSWSSAITSDSQKNNLALLENLPKFLNGDQTRAVSQDLA